MICGDPRGESLRNAAGSSCNRLELAWGENNCNKYNKKCDEKSCQTEGREIHEVDVKDEEDGKGERGRGWRCAFYARGLPSDMTRVDW